MDTKNNSHNRPISAQTLGLRPYDDNCDEIDNICKESGLKPGEVLRDLVDEGIRARRNYPIATTGVMHILEQLVEQNNQLIEQNRQLIEQNGSVKQQCEVLLEKYEGLEGRSDGLRRGLIQNLREFYSILLETLSASIGARRLAWNYIVQTVLKQNGFTDDQIKQRYEDERKAWIDEKDNIADALEEAIKNMPSRQ